MSYNNDQTKTHYDVTGYRKWYSPFYYNDNKDNFRAFIVDFETFIFREEVSKNDLSFEEQEQSSNQYRSISGIIVYFLDSEGQKRRAFLSQTPYFYLLPQENIENDEKRISGLINFVRNVDTKKITNAQLFKGYDSKDLVFLKEKTFIKVSVQTPSDVPHVRDKCEQISGIEEWREADIQFHHRVAIDNGLRVGKWYHLTIRGGEIQKLSEIKDLTSPNLNIVAYDIEVENPRTRDPSVEKDEITMVSLFNGLNNLVIVNANTVKCDDVEDINILLRNDENEDYPIVDWAPISNKEILKDENIVESQFTTIKTVDDEKELIIRFLRYIEELKPDIIADFYGDKFDMPYLIGRARKYGINITSRTGFKINWKLSSRNLEPHQLNLMKDVESVASFGPMHLDAFLWNDKYSYLPKKDLGLKPSVKARLKIIPIDREALWGIDDNPTEAIAYNASDGYITWRYVKEIIIDFILSMGQMFPVPASELLTKTAGALDDLLVDGIGHTKRIVAQKRVTQYVPKSLTKNIIITNIAYTGGMVGVLNPGIWRSDIKYDIPVDEDESNHIINLLPSIYDSVSKNLLENVKKEQFEKQIMPIFNDEQKYYDFLRVANKSNYLEEALKILQNIKSKKEFTQAKKNIDDIQKRISKYKVTNTEDNKKELIENIKNATKISNQEHVKPIGLHIDVTSMYPNQIRQYKIQPSGLVHPEKECKNCKYRENDGSCWIEQTWTAKLTARKPCLRKDGDYCIKLRKKCPYDIGLEEKCKIYDSLNVKAEEFWTYLDNQEKAYSLSNKKLEKISTNESFIGREFSNTSDGLFQYLDKWVSSNIEGTMLANEGLGNIGIALFAPKNSFLYIDAKAKNLNILLSVKSRFCQKAYSHVHAVMDDFFKMRIFHKNEAKRISRIIKLKESQNEIVSSELQSKQKFHNSTQLGLKVPLNSIYGLLGMKAGVHNASLPCAGVTTALSADLIKWGVDKIKKIGKVTEYDTDGVWCFVPQQFPVEFDLEVSNEDNKIISQKSVPLLEEVINKEIEDSLANENFWEYNSEGEYQRKRVCLLTFEQDGPYNFQFIMGKKKYIVYNYNKKKKKWIEKEIIGLETKRADFSKLHKDIQMAIIEAFQVDFDSTEEISIENLYQSAIDTAISFISNIEKGKVDIEDFVQSKAISKPLNEYSTLLPQVAGALMLQELGYNIEIGLRIELLKIKTAGKKKSEAVVPKQLFEFPVEKIKSVLRKRGIGTMLFEVRDIQTVEELKKELIDIKAYIEDLVGKDKIIDRMILQPMRKQKVKLKIPLLLGGNKKDKTKTMNIFDLTKKTKKEKKTKSMIKSIPKKSSLKSIKSAKSNDITPKVTKNGNHENKVPNKENKVIKDSLRKELTSNYKFDANLIDNKAKIQKSNQNIEKNTKIIADQPMHNGIPTNRTSNSNSNLKKNSNGNLFDQWSDQIPYSNGNKTNKQSFIHQHNNNLFNELKSSFTRQELLELSEGEPMEVFFCSYCNKYFEVFNIPDYMCPYCLEPIVYIYDLNKHNPD